jgi:putative Holliday junction resolvase
MRVLAVDPGDVRIGIALSDPTGTIANPLTIIQHTSRQADAGAIAQLAVDHHVKAVIVGATYDDAGQLTPQGRRAERLADAVRDQMDIPVILWDESGSTLAVRGAMIELGTSKRKRRKRVDDRAAAYILQTYLDAQEQDRGSEIRDQGSGMSNQ